jgi:hypothetical protein
MYVTRFPWKVHINLKGVTSNNSVCPIRTYRSIDLNKISDPLVVAF